MQNLEQDHRADHVARLEVVERLRHVVEADALADHGGEVEPALARPFDQAREVERRQVVAAVGDDDPQPPVEERLELDRAAAPGCGRPM